MILLMMPRLQVAGFLLAEKNNSTRLRSAPAQLYFPENWQQCSGCPMGKHSEERDREDCLPDLTLLAFNGPYGRYNDTSLRPAAKLPGGQPQAQDGTEKRARQPARSWRGSGRSRLRRRGTTVPTAPRGASAASSDGTSAGRWCCGGGVRAHPVPEAAGCPAAAW